MPQRKHEFFIPCEPPKATWQSGLSILKKRIGRKVINFVGTPAGASSAQAKKLLALILRKHKPEQPLQAPVCLHVCYVYPYSKSLPKYKKQNPLEWHTTKPDCSNIVKLIEDVMQELGYFSDDAGNAKVIIEKYNGNQSGIYISLHELTQADISPTLQSLLQSKQ